MQAGPPLERPQHSADGADPPLGPANGNAKLTVANGAVDRAVDGAVGGSGDGAGAGAAHTVPPTVNRHSGRWVLKSAPFQHDTAVDEFADQDEAPFPEAGSSPRGTDEANDVLEADEEHEALPAASVYPASQYPVVPVRYRVERVDTATINSSERSLYVEDLDYVLENGRRYCGNYIFPNDELEQDRMRVMHQVYLQLFDFELTSVPLDEPQYILDIGTGTGEWAIGMGELYPSTEVVGVDISAIQPTAVPHNVFFEIDDCQIDWMRPEDSADLVHFRDMAGAFTDWDFVYREALACLKPGGYIELLDLHDQTSDTNPYLELFPPEAQIHAFARAIDEASIRAGRRRGVHHLDPAALERLGFVDVTVSEHVIPINPVSGPVAKLVLIGCLHSIESASLRLLTRYMGWDAARAFEMCETVCQEIRVKALARAASEADVLKIALRVVTARKPPSPKGGLPGTDGDEDVEMTDDRLQSSLGSLPLAD